jgi:hypothetical protein
MAKALASDTVTACSTFPVPNFSSVSQDRGLGYEITGSQHANVYACTIIPNQNDFVDEIFHFIPQSSQFSHPPPTIRGDNDY